MMLAHVSLVLNDFSSENSCINACIQQISYSTLCLRFCVISPLLIVDSGFDSFMRYKQSLKTIEDLIYYDFLKSTLHPLNLFVDRFV